MKAILWIIFFLVSFAILTALPPEPSWGPLKKRQLNKASGKIGGFFKKRWRESTNLDVTTTAGSFATQILNEKTLGERMGIAQLWQQVPQKKRDEYYSRFMNDIVYGIVQSDDPKFEIRRMILFSIRASTIGKSILTDGGFDDHRTETEKQFLYEAFSIDTSDEGDDVTPEQLLFKMFMESELHSIVLCWVYEKCFEENETKFWRDYRHDFEEIIMHTIDNKLGKTYTARFELVTAPLFSNLDSIHQYMLNESFDMCLPFWPLKL